MALDGGHKWGKQSVSYFAQFCRGSVEVVVVWERVVVC